MESLTLRGDLEVSGTSDHDALGLEARAVGLDLAGIAGEPLDLDLEGRPGDVLAVELDEHFVFALDRRVVRHRVRQVPVVVELDVHLRIE